MTTGLEVLIIYGGWWDSSICGVEAEPSPFSAGFPVLLGLLRLRYAETARDFFLHHLASLL